MRPTRNSEWANKTKHTLQNLPKQVRKACGAIGLLIEVSGPVNSRFDVQLMCSSCPLVGSLLSQVSYRQHYNGGI